MWKLCFLLTAWLAHAFVNGENSSINAETIHTDVDIDYDKIAEDYLSTLSLAHSKSSSRKRRDTFDTTLLMDEKGVYRLKGLRQVSQLCHPAIFSKFLDVWNITYAICVKAGNDDDPAEVRFGEYRDHTWTVTKKWFVGSPTGLDAFSYYKYIYVLVADSERHDGTDLVKIDIYKNKLEVDHIVHSKSATSISIWMMKNYDTYHMAIANSGESQNDSRSEVYIYEWRGTYFDRYDVFPAYNVKDIKPFHIYGNAYLAVANFRRGKSNLPVDSEILKYNLDKKKWLSHQKLKTYGATDWEFFTLGTQTNQEFFLVVANSDAKGMNPVIYKFVKDQFVPFQCLPVDGATSSAAWFSETGFLLAVSNYDGVFLFQYDGWQFVRSNIQYTRHPMSYGNEKHMVFHSILRDNQEVVILSVSNGLPLVDYSIFEVDFEHENSLGKWYDESTKWCLNTLEALKRNSIDPHGLFEDVAFIDQPTPIVIEGDLIFDEGFESKKVETPQITSIKTEETFDGSMLQNLKGLQERLERVNLKIKDFEKVLKNAVRTTGNQTITGHLKFNDVKFDCGEHTCSFGSINTTVLNGEEIGDWSKNLVFLDSEQTIHGTIKAEEIIVDHLTVNGMIDGIDSKTLVTKSGDHNITATKTFIYPITARDVEVHGLVDGVKISRDNVLLTTGLQNITGDLMFENLETSWLDVHGNVNGRDLRAFYDDVVLFDRESTITGEKLFHDVIVDNLLMNPGTTINGVDLLDLWQNALWKNGPQEVLAPMTFQSMSVLKNLQAPMGINDILIPGPRVVHINQPATVMAPHFFQNSTKVAHLNVLKSLNGLPTIKQEGNNIPGLDIMLKTGGQVVTGKKTFGTIHLDADSTVTGTVNEVDLSEFKDMVLRRNPSMDSNRTWIFNNLEIKGPLSVNTISGYNLTDIYEKALKLTDTEISEVTFKDLLSIHELECHNINGIDISNDLVIKNKPQKIFGKKVFNEIVLKENSVIINEINNVNISFLNDTLLRIGNQAVKSKVFHGNVKMNRMAVKGSINNVPIEEFVTLNKNEAISSRELVNVSFHEVEAINVEVIGKVNDIDVEEMMRNTLTVNGHEQVTGTKTIKGTIHVADNNDLTVNFINGVNIKELLDDAVYNDVPQNISGVKTFEAPVTFNNLIFNTIDGVSENDMQNWMLRDAHQVVTGDVIFTENLTIGNLNINGLINGINVTELNESIVKLDEENVIEGPIIFENVVISKGDITLSGTVQGVKLADEVVTRTDSVVITGEKAFTQELSVGNAKVGGLVDGVSIDELCQTAFLMHNEQNITRLTIKGDVTFLGGGKVEGKVAGVDLMQLRDIAVSTEEKEVTFLGHKSFENLTIEGHVTLKGRVNGVDLKDLNDNYMSLTREQEITANMQFDRLNILGTLSAIRFDTDNQMVNQVNISKLNRILRKDQFQDVNVEHKFTEVVFESDVFVLGEVNGIKLPDGLMRRNHPNYIQGSKVFTKPLKVLGDLTMQEGNTINGIDVSEWKRKAVLGDGRSYTIDGHKTFHNLSLVDARVEGLVDGLKISNETLLMTYGDQVITGKKTIIGDVEAKKSINVSGLVNGVNLTALADNTLQRNRSNVITGQKTFQQPLVIKNLHATTVAGVDVTELAQKINKYIDLNDLENRLEEIGEVVDKMRLSLNKQAMVFQYYEMYQEFAIPTVYASLYVPGEVEDFFLLSDSSSPSLDRGCTTVRVFHSGNADKFVGHSQELNASYAISLKTMQVAGIDHLFIANAKPNRNCSETKIGYGNTTVNIYTLQNGRFEEQNGLETPPLTDMVAFQDSVHSCVVLVEAQQCSLYCSTHEYRNFEFREALFCPNAGRASTIQTSNRIILSVVCEFPITDIEHTRSVSIYFWNNGIAQFEEQVQFITVTYPQSILLISGVFENEEQVFLIIAEGQVPGIQNKAKLQVYKLDEESAVFLKYQEIDDYGELDSITLQSGELFLFVLNTGLGKLKLYQHKGVSGFVNVDTIAAVGSIRMHPFIRPSDPINHYLALTGPDVSMAQPSQGNDYAKILKSKMKGIRQFY